MAVRAKAAKKKRARSTSTRRTLDRFAFDPESYIIEVLGWTPSSQQVDVLEAYRTSLRAQHERLDFQAGRLDLEDLEDYDPDKPVQFEIRVEAGHGIGKTKLGAGIVSHFYDCFSPVTGYTFAPTWTQLRDLLWKELLSDREGKSLPGRMLSGSLALIRSARHFIRARAFDRSHGKGRERIHGQHSPYSIYVFEEAEGVPKDVFAAVRTMAGGGVRIVLYYGNPRSRNSEFYRIRNRRTVKNFRLSTLDAPNVLAGREVIPGGQTREWVEGMIRDHCDEVPEHDPDRYTFRVDWYRNEDDDCPILLPDDDFLYQVLGIPPLRTTDRTVIPYGRFDAATRRTRPEAPGPRLASIGVDVARFGNDRGTVYVRHGDAVWRSALLQKKDSFDYVEAIEDAVESLPDSVREVSIRFDGGGGWASGAVDVLRTSEVLRSLEEWEIIEVQFGAAAYERTKYHDLITELYFDAAEALQGLAVLDPPDELEADLCDRKYDYRKWRQYERKRLDGKDAFRKDIGRSPDDGDGFALAVGARYLLDGQYIITNAGRRRGRVGAER